MTNDLKTKVLTALAAFGRPVTAGELLGMAPGFRDIRSTELALTLSGLVADGQVNRVARTIPRFTGDPCPPTRVFLSLEGGQ